MTKVIVHYRSNEKPECIKEFFTLVIHKKEVIIDGLTGTVIEYVWLNQCGELCSDWFDSVETARNYLFNLFNKDNLIEIKFEENEE